MSSIKTKLGLWLILTGSLLFATSFAVHAGWIG